MLLSFSIRSLLLSLIWGGLCLLPGCDSEEGEDKPESFGQEAAPKEVELRNQLQEARKHRIADLEEYVKMGQFPHNHDFEGSRVPYLIDRHGRLCAVAYLVASSEIPDFNYQKFTHYHNRAAWGYSVGSAYHPQGKEPDAAEQARRAEAAKRVAASEKSYREFGKKLLGFNSGNNQLRLMDLKDGQLMEWVRNSGLTLEECALIQPSYSYLSCNECLPASEQAEGGALNRPPGEAESTHQLRAVDFGQPTPESLALAQSDRARIRKHLSSVLEKLRADSEASLDLAVTRLTAK